MNSVRDAANKRKVTITECEQTEWKGTLARSGAGRD